MLCSYRFYVRPQRPETPQSGPQNITAEPRPTRTLPPPRPVVLDTPPHLAIVRQYAW